MDYEKRYVFDLMLGGGPTDVREPYFKEAVDEMMRARTFCVKANACMPGLSEEYRLKSSGIWIRRNRKNDRHGGGKHSWRLQGGFTLRKENGNWKLTSSKASTY